MKRLFTLLLSFLPALALAGNGQVLKPAKTNVLETQAGLYTFAIDASGVGPAHVSELHLLDRYVSLKHNLRMKDLSFYSLDKGEGVYRYHFQREGRVHRHKIPIVELYRLTHVEP